MKEKYEREKQDEGWIIRDMDTGRVAWESYDDDNIICCQVLDALNANSEHTPVLKVNQIRKNGYRLSEIANHASGQYYYDENRKAKRVLTQARTLDGEVQAAYAVLKESWGHHGCGAAHEHEIREHFEAGYLLALAEHKKLEGEA